MADLIRELPVLFLLYAANEVQCALKLFHLRLLEVGIREVPDAFVFVESPVAQRGTNRLGDRLLD